MSNLKQLQQQQLDFQKVAPLNSNRLVTFINHFIITIVDQLNEFSTVADSKLHQLNNKINICHANLVILEMKLNSISGLSSLPTNSSKLNKEDQEITSQEQTDVQVTESNTQDNQVEGTTEVKNEIEENQEDTKSEEQVEEDPRLAKYRKMFSFGIPLEAIHQKMVLEGVDPNLLKL